jgi:hypothetical protein
MSPESSISLQDCKEVPMTEKIQTCLYPLTSIGLNCLLNWDESRYIIAEGKDYS